MRSQHRILVYAMGAVLLVPWSMMSAEPNPKSTGTLLLKNADNSLIQMQNGEAVSTLNGHVKFEYDDLTIHSDNARWWRNQGIIKLNNRVLMEKPSERVKCDEMTFYKSKSMLYLRGHVQIEQDKEIVRVTGDDGRYDLKQKLFTLNIKPKFMKFDTSAAETLIIVGRKMIYSDSQNIAVAETDVTIDKAQLHATCNRCQYDTHKSMAHLRGNPDIAYGPNTVKGDSVDLFFANDTLRGVSVKGKAHGKYRESGEKDTNITHVWSDSMYLALTPAGRLDSMYSFGNVRSTYYLGATSDSANQVTGKTMILAFDTAGVILTARVWGNATSIYYVIDAEGNGRNEASGDTINVIFDKGRASQLTLSGAVRGVYFSIE